MCLVHTGLTQGFFCAVNLRRELTLRNRQNISVTHVCNGVGVIDNYFSGCFFAQVAELCQHFVGGSQVEAGAVFSILKALPCHQNISVNRRCFVLVVSIGGSYHQLAQLICHGHDAAVDIFQFIITGNQTLFQHEPVVYQRLDFQVVVAAGDSFYFFV